MATINHILNYTLSLVILPFVVEKNYYIESWKKKLHIIAVCSRWRKLAIHFVYNQVFFIDYDIFWNTNSQLYSFKKSQSSAIDNQPEDKGLITNVDLIVSNNRCYLAEAMLINVNEYGAQGIFLDKLFDVFKQTAGGWSGIKSIFLNSIHIPALDNIANCASLDYDYGYDLTPIIDFMKSSFTSVGFIEHSHSNDLMGSFGYMIIQLFMDKIPCISGEMSLVSHLKYLPQHVTHLDLNFSYVSETVVLPTIVAESLKELTLTSLPPDFNWMCFENSSEPHYNNICFKNLEYLHVYYDLDDYYTHASELESSDLIDRFRFKMIFPKLIELLIQHCSRNNSLLHADFPNKVNKIWFRGSIASLALFRQIKIKSELAIIQFTDDVMESDQDSDAMDRTPQNYNKVDKIYLLFQNVELTLSHINLVYGPKVETININFSIPIQLLENVLSSTSNLKVLILQRSATYTLLFSILRFVYFRKESTSRYTLFANIQHVSLNYSVDADYDSWLALIKYFLVVCPNLRYISARVDIKQDLEQFIDSNSEHSSYLRKDVIEYF